MARYRKVSVQIWNDAKFRRFTDDGKLAFLFLLTHPHMTSVGAMRATVEGLAAELSWSSERLSEAFRKGIDEGMIFIDHDASTIALPHFIRHNPPESPNVVKSWATMLEVIPEGKAKALAVKQLKEFGESLSGGFRKAFGSLAEDFRKSMPNPEHEQEHELEHEHEQEHEQEKAMVGKPTGATNGASMKTSTTSNHRRRKAIPIDYSPAFELFWAANPRKTGKAVAWEAFQHAIDRIIRDDRPILAECLDEDAKRVVAGQWITSKFTEFCRLEWPPERLERVVLRDGNAHPMPHASTWLNAARFDDDPIDWIASQKPPEF